MLLPSGCLRNAPHKLLSCQQKSQTPVEEPATSGPEKKLPSGFPEASAGRQGSKDLAVFLQIRPSTFLCPSFFTIAGGS